MKKVIIVFLFLSLSIPDIKAQVQTEDPGYGVKQLDRRSMTRESIKTEQEKIEHRLYDIDNIAKRGTFHNVTIGQYDDTTFLMIYAYKTRYLGNLKHINQKNTEFIRDGWGTERTPASGQSKYRYSRARPDPSAKNYEYYIGHWQDNFRHGNGFFIDYSGKAFAGIWKNGYVKSKSIRELTPRETEYVQKMKEVIDNLDIQ